VHRRTAAGMHGQHAYFEFTGQRKEIKTLTKADVLLVLPIVMHNDLFIPIHPKFGGGSTKNILSMAFVVQCSMYSQSLLYCILKSGLYLEVLRRVTRFFTWNVFRVGKICAELVQENV